MCGNRSFKFSVPCSGLTPQTRSTQSGLTLVELVMFIVIVSVGLAGILSVLDYTTKKSADPALRKQALAIAESLLEEAQLMPFTFCDPDDANAAVAQNSIVGNPQGCATLSEDAAIGPEGETRYSLTAPFDNASDYHGFTMNGIADIIGVPVAGLGAYSAAVQVTQQALGGIPAADSLRIVVTVTAPGNETVTLEGYRARYAPNAVP